MSGFIYEKDSDGIVLVTMDMSGSVNAMNDEYHAEMGQTLERLEAEKDLTGVVIASAKSIFFAGADLNVLKDAEPGNEATIFEMVESTKAQLRRLEKLPVPVVAAINGAALGGGFEICLASNYRIAYQHKATLLGLPEVTLGLLPGGGGVVRMVNLLGLEKALPYLLEGHQMTPDKALKAGLIDEVVDSLDELTKRAKTWILENRATPDVAVQPWDRKGHKIPGGNATEPHIGQLLMMASVMLRQKTRGLLPAPTEILDVAAAAARLDFDVASRLESRGMVRLLLSPVAKNMIATFFFGMTKIKQGASRPKDVPAKKIGKLGVLGAGLMGQGIAYVSARSGIEVVLKDISQEAAEKGKAYSEKLLAKRVERGRMSEEAKSSILSLITPTSNDDDLQGCDLIIEAVFENLELKQKVIQSTESRLAEGGVWASNTSSLPITKQAESAATPGNFIGIHFFSPVDKMPLVEIICGEKTSDTTLALAFDYVQQLRKTPIVVNDSLGFYTSRTFGTYLDEGARLLLEGLHPTRIDNLGKAFGMPVGPLAVHDEVGITLSKKAMETWDGMGMKDKWGEQDAVRQVVATLLDEHGRGGRNHGGGFYEYKADGSKQIWPKLIELYYKPDADLPAEDVKDRLLFRQVIEVLKCLESSVLRSVVDGNVGSVMGIGAPPWTGGFIQFVNTYGLERFSARCAELAKRYGERFEAPAIVAEKIKAGALFD